jgi:hypothetical protein
MDATKDARYDLLLYDADWNELDCLAFQAMRLHAVMMILNAWDAHLRGDMVSPYYGLLFSSVSVVEIVPYASRTENSGRNGTGSVSKRSKPRSAE